MSTPPVSVIVGIDGSGKTSTFRDALVELARAVPVAGIGDEVLAGAPGVPLAARPDVPRTGAARVLGRLAKQRRMPALYKNLKFWEFVERTRIRDHVIAHAPPQLVLTDGDPLVNVAGWAAARFHRGELADGDDLLYAALHYLSGDWRIPTGELRYVLRHAWQLVVLNRLHLARFRFPDQVFLLAIDPAVAMDRIRARGRPLQAHEHKQFLGELAQAYERVCRVLEERCGVPVVRIPVDRQPHEQSVRMVVESLLERVPTPAAQRYDPGWIEVVATTMSGSLEDQRKVGRIGPAFAAAGDTPVRVHVARSHAEAARHARRIVAGGGRTLVSAGGAGTFNAVLEGSHVDGSPPADLRLAFLRKGSADLIGKALHVPDDLAGAVAAITDAIATDRCLPADVLAVEAATPDGRPQRMHMIGFGGSGVFGEVPRFTETRLVKYYKGVLGTLLGDLGPFFVGLALALVWWWVRHLFRRTPRSVLTLDGDRLPAADWAAIIVLNGDLGDEFPLGHGLPFGSGTFRVVALRYRGVRHALRQFLACRTGAVLERPDYFDALVREARSLAIRPTGAWPRQMFNVDGLRLSTRGEVRVAVTGRVRLVAGEAAADRRPAPAPTR